MPTAAPFDPQTLPLRDIHLPDPVGWWPPALGWWLLLGLTLLLLAMLVYLWRRRRRSRFRRLALRELDRLAQLPTGELAAALSQLLRQAALCHFPRHEVAGLCGEAWLAFLDRPFADRPFAEGIGRSLLDAPYRPGAAVDGQALLALGRRWLRHLPLPPGRGR
jgi:hypothetical protein